jgi:hypothetical protein
MKKVAPKPVSASYIEKVKKINYRTARDVLEEMLASDRVEKFETVGFSFYVLPDWQPAFLGKNKEKDVKVNVIDGKNIS